MKKLLATATVALLSLAFFALKSSGNSGQFAPVGRVISALFGDLFC